MMTNDDMNELVDTKLKIRGLVGARLKTRFEIISAIEDMGYTREQAIQLVLWESVDKVSSHLKQIEGDICSIVSPFKENRLRVDSGTDGEMELIRIALYNIDNTLDGVSDTIDRLGDNLTNSINAIEEDICTGKVSIKGRIDNYNLN